jgi:outer membrane protein assembly factor BamB
VAAVAVALGAAVVFFGTYLRRPWQLQQLRQLKRYRGPVRLASVVAAVVALCVVLFVTSPLDYRSSAPAPAGLKLYVLSASNDLFTLRASDGAQTFVRHLPGPQLQTRYYEDGLLILSGGGPDVPAAPTGTAGTAASESAAASDQVSTYTLRAVHSDDGQAALPALGALAYVTADTLEQGTLYVTAIADPAHPDSETLSAFSMQAGTLLWQHAFTTSTPMSPQFCGSDSGALYVLLGTSITAVRTGDGAVLWRSAPLWRSGPLNYAFRCVVQDGGVYIVVPGRSVDDSQVLIKLEERDGTQLWSVPVAWLVSVAGDRLYVAREAQLLVLRASDGGQIGAPLGISVSALQAPYPPASSAGVLFVVGRSIKPQLGDALSPCEVFAIRLRDGARLWHRPPHACFYPRELRVAGDTLYYMTTDGDLTAFRIADGGVLWTHSGYHRGGLYTHWSDTYAVSALGPGVLFVDANHDVPCQYLVVGCDPDNGQYLDALNPTTGALYWRYRSDQVAGYFLSASG